MRRFTHSLLIGLLAMAASTSVSAQPEPVDRIAVVVADKIILASEVANQVQLIAIQTGNRPKNEDELKKLQAQVLEDMISDELFLMEAKKDTSIEVRTEEVDMALEEQIERVMTNFGSEEAFLSALASEGMTLRDLRKQYREEIHNQMLKQRFIQKKLFSVSISRHEVEQFYEEFKDSIPTQPEAVKLAHILLEIEPAPEVEDSVKGLAAELREKVLEGADFATISVQYSSLGAGANGGDLGWMSRDDVAPDFARAAFQLQPGDISGVIRTQFGYHVIKCEGRRNEQLRLRHILLAVPPSPADTTRAHNLADSLLTELRENGADFAELAKAFSRDDDTRAQGGELGWFASKDLPQEFASAVAGWREPGEYRGPVESRFGLHIIKLQDYQAEKTLSLEDDYDRIKELARQDKTGRIVDDWIAEIKEKTYIDYRIEI